MEESPEGDGSQTGVAPTLPPRIDSALASGLDLPPLAVAAAPAVRPVAGDCATLQRVERERYLLGETLARGGMGEIRRARDRHLGRDVAIKELIERSPELAARFEREARITARLQHPAIVTLHEAGRWPSGEPFRSTRWSSSTAAPSTR
jgi:eukaryotic-like serine/threonine-protein kinase